MVSAQNLTLATNSGTHAKKRDFACTFEGCSNAYTRKIHLQRHLTSHSDKKDFVCLEDNCGKAFNNNDTLKKHIRRIHRERLFKCSHEGCNRTFRKHQHLTVHSFVHTNIKPFKCQHEGCEARFQVPSKLKSHAKIHKGYTCNKEGCGRHFDKWTGLRKHLSDDHITGKKFKFITSSEPWRLCHYAICKYEHKCELCGKVYFKRHKLRVHMKSHEKIKEVFICPRENCNRSYLKPSYLELHIKNYHDGGRPYACDHPGCSKTFIHKCSLSKHQVVHEPDYVRPPPKPRKKRGLASRLSGYPDEASRLPHPKIETNIFNRAYGVTGGVTSVEAAEEMDSTAHESEDVLDAAPTVTMETSGSDTGDSEGKAEVREMEDEG